MTAIVDSPFARVTKETIVRDYSADGALTGNTIAYDATNTINEKIDSIVVSGGGNVGIQFEDEGVALGTQGTVDTVNFTGTGVTASRVGDEVTVNISGGGVTDHGALTGLADDDHTQYTKADGTRSFSGKVSYTSHPTFSADTEIVDKKYVDDAIIGGGGYTDEQAQDAVGSILVDSSTIDFTYNDATPSITGIVVDGSITTTKLGGDVTAAGKALLDDTDASAQRTTLGLGTLATQSGTFSGTSSGTNTGDQTNIVGITGTFAQFNTAVTDADLARTDAANTFTGTQTITQIDLGNTDTSFTRLSAGEAGLEGKRILTTSPLVVSAASYTTDTGTSLNMDNLDMFIITAQAGALLFNAPGGTLVQGRKLIIRIKDNGTARALTWNAIFRAMGVSLPSTTVLGKTLYLGFVYNSTDTKWDLVASAQEA